MIVVVDYGAANLLSITRALEVAGAAVEVSDRPTHRRGAGGRAARGRRGGRGDAAYAGLRVGRGAA